MFYFLKVLFVIYIIIVDFVFIQFVIMKCVDIIGL